jgi:hypothetical protein
VPYISLLTDPTTGGVTASFAIGDVIWRNKGHHLLYRTTGAPTIHASTCPRYGTAEFCSTA